MLGCPLKKLTCPKNEPELPLCCCRQPPPICPVPPFEPPPCPPPCCPPPSPPPCPRPCPPPCCRKLPCPPCPPPCPPCPPPCTPCPPCPPPCIPCNPPNCPPCCCPGTCAILDLLGRPGPCPFRCTKLPEGVIEEDDFCIMSWGIATPEGFEYKKNEKKGNILDKPLLCCDCCQCTDVDGLGSIETPCPFGPKPVDPLSFSSDGDVCPTKKKKVCSKPPCSRNWNSNMDTCLTKEEEEPLPSCLPTYDGSCRPAPYCLRTHPPCFVPSCLRCYGCPPPVCTCLDDPCRKEKPEDKPEKKRAPPSSLSSPSNKTTHKSETSPKGLSDQSFPKPIPSIGGDAELPTLNEISTQKISNEISSRSEQKQDNNKPENGRGSKKKTNKETSSSSRQKQDNSKQDKAADSCCCAPGGSERKEQGQQCPPCPPAPCCCCCQDEGEKKPDVIDIPPCTMPGCTAGKGKPTEEEGSKGGGCPCKSGGAGKAGGNNYCPVQTEPCPLFPEGRCPVEDLGNCDCDFPVPPCMVPPQCGETPDAPPQYCVKEECCMGLPLPPTEPSVKDDYDGKMVYYQLNETKPGREETKYCVEILDEPPKKDIFPKREREHPKWSIKQQGKGFEECRKVQEMYARRGPTDTSSFQVKQFETPMSPEMIAIANSKKLNAARA